jgi:hypothetical protein
MKGNITSANIPTNSSTIFPATDSLDVITQYPRRGLTRTTIARMRMTSKDYLSDSLKYRMIGALHETCHVILAW